GWAPFVIGAGALALYRMRRPPTNGDLDRKSSLLLVALGLMLYALVPAFMFLGLDRADAVTFNFVFQAGIPLVLAFTAGSMLKERTSSWEWAGVAIVIAGMYAFFPAVPSGAEATGVMLAALAAFGIGGSNLIQRKIMRAHVISSLDAAMKPMALGSVALFGIALAIEGVPSLDLEAVALLLVLGVVNTAFAFTIWHQAMRTLKALHAGVIASAQIVEVAVLAWWILGESLTGGRIVGSVVVLAGIYAVHFSKARALRASGQESQVSTVG
ncbi:MAG: DMT family transporter, partial [Acidimicrobiia bacterium]